MSRARWPASRCSGAATLDLHFAVLHAGPAAVNEWLATLRWREAGELLSAFEAGLAQPVPVAR